jgi:hypothetical protein
LRNLETSQLECKFDGCTHTRDVSGLKGMQRHLLEEHGFTWDRDKNKNN